MMYFKKRCFKEERSFLGSGVLRNIFGRGRFTTEIFFVWGSTNSVENRGQRKRGSGGGSPLVRGYTQFANE
jgi:hypothetical protein